MTSETMLLLYKSLLRSLLEYASCVWSPYLKSDKDLLENVQRRATRMVPELKKLSYSERLQSLKLPTLIFRRKRADIIQTYKILSGKDTLNMDPRCSKCINKSMFQSTLSHKTRGHDLKLQKPEATGVRHRFLATRVVDDWNHLSSETVHVETINQFKAGLARDWSDHPDLYEYRFS